MDPADALQTTAELAIAIVGFAGVVAAFQARGEAKGDELYRIRLAALLGVPLSAMLASLVPMYFLAGKQPVSWPALSGFQGFILWMFAVYFGRQWLRLRAGSQLFGAFGMIGTLTLAIILTRAWLQDGDFQVYLSGILWQLAISAIVFVRMAMVSLFKGLPNGTATIEVAASLPKFPADGDGG